MLFHKYFYSLWRTDIFARQTKNTILFSNHKWFPLGSRMSWRIKPFINIHWGMRQYRHHLKYKCQNQRTPPCPKSRVVQVHRMDPVLGFRQLFFFFRSGWSCYYLTERGSNFNYIYRKIQYCTFQPLIWLN